MDKLTIFGGVTEVSFVSEEGNTIDSVVAKMEDVLEQLRASHRGQERHEWGAIVPLDEDEDRAEEPFDGGEEE